MQIAAQLAISRAKLFWSLLGLNADQLEQPIWDDWSARKLIAHIGRWDAFEAERLQALIDGRIDETHSVNVDTINAEWAAKDADMTLDAAVAIVQKERNGFLNVIATADDDLLRSTITLPDGFELFAMQGINNSIEHDDDHAADIMKWRKENDLRPYATLGERSILVAAMRSGRNAVLAAYELAKDDVAIDDWRANDVLAHLVGWERYLISTVEQLESTPAFADPDSANAAFVKEFHGQAVLKPFKQLRRQSIGLAESADLTAKIANSNNATVYGFIAGYLGHDIEHADEMYGAWLKSQRTKR